MNQYDIVYGIGVGLASPFWLIRPKSRKKVLRAFSERMGHFTDRDPSQPAVMIHAVSLGEINATRSLVESLRAQRPGMQFIVSVTTDTGFEQGQKLYGKSADVRLIRYPLDFSAAVDRLLNALRPNVVVLLELEVWPNFISRCVQRNIPVALINGRITEGSYRRYRLARPLIGGMFSKLSRVCVQDETYCKRFIELGVPEGRVSVTGSMKFDTAQVGDRIDGQEKVAADLGLSPGKEKIWVCGSTGPGEEEIILPIYRRLREKFPDLRLAIIPRKPERFDEVARLIAESGFALIRRSRNDFSNSAAGAVILGDTMGELRKFYAIADVVFVGRTLVDLGARQHGSDMIEPSALAKACIVGPFTGNFADPMERFVAANAMTVVRDSSGLSQAVETALGDPAGAREIGKRAQEVVRLGQGATERHVKIILDMLDSVSTIAIKSGEAHG
jgi:3-deoxy-D-manno-octulosonic-acid transferase